MAEKWNPKTSLPNLNTVIVVKLIPEADCEYKILEIVNSQTQSLVETDPEIVGWQYTSEFITSIPRGNKNVLSGVSEWLDNDWTPTIDGYIQMQYDINMLSQQINSRIQTLPTEVDGFDGIDYMNVIFGRTSVEQKAAALAEVIQNIPTVKSVTFINASWIDKKEGIFQFTFNIQSIFGDLQFVMGLDIQNKKVFAQN